MDKVNKCLDDVERKMTKLNSITSKGAENVTMKEVIKSARKGNSITATFKKGSKELSALSPSDPELKEILVKMDRIITLQEKSMEFTVANKPYFDKMHVSGVVKKAMQKSEGTSQDLTKILIEKCPSGLKPEAEALDQRAQKSLQAGLNAYSNATGGEEKFDDQVDDSD